MLKTKIRSQLLELVDSDSDDGLRVKIRQLKPAAAKTTKTTMPPKKTAAAATGRGATANANKVTKPAQKASATRSSGRAAMAETSINVQSKSATGGRGRKPAVSAAPVEEDITMEDAPAPAIEAKSTRGRPKKSSSPGEAQLTAVVPARGQRGRKPSAAKVEHEITVMDITEIPETQPEALLPGTPVSAEEDDEADELSGLPTLPSSSRFATNSRGGSAPPPGSASRRQNSSSSDASDPALRRRLGELTARNESLETRYRDLREIGVKEAERNFDRYKKQSEEKSKRLSPLHILFISPPLTIFKWPTP